MNHRYTRKQKLEAVVFAQTMLIAGLAVFCSSCSREAELLRAENGQVQAELAVPVARVERADISRETTLTAEFEAFQEVDVMAKVAGYVRSIRVDLGDRVNSGDLLAVLEVPEMQDDLLKSSAAIERSTIGIATAQDELVRTESAHRIAHLSYQRILEVSKREPGLVPQQEIDEAEAKDRVAEAQVATAKSKVRAAEQETQLARADQARLKTMEKYVSITAPFAGIVTKRYANTGSMIQAGTASQLQAMPLVRLSQDDVLRLRLPVPESMVSAVRRGVPVTVQMPSLNRVFPGRIVRFAAKVDKATRTMPTEVDVPNPSFSLMPGMYAQVMLPLLERSNAVSVPIEAVERSGTATRVYRVDKGGKINVITVQLGIENTTRAEVLSGLDEGDHVVVGRRAGLKDGEKVRPKLIDSTVSMDARKDRS